MDAGYWLPFGGGIRRCIGMAFAQFEMRIVLQTVVPRAHMKLARGPARVVRRGITLAPAGGTRVVLERRLAGSGGNRNSTPPAGKAMGVGLLGAGNIANWAYLPRLRSGGEEVIH